MNIILVTLFTFFSVVLGVFMLMCSGIVYCFVVLPLALVYLTIHYWRQKQ